MSIVFFSFFDKIISTLEVYTYISSYNGVCVCICGVYINQLQEDVNSADRIGKNREKRRYIESWKNTGREKKGGGEGGR